MVGNAVTMQMVRFPDGLKKLFCNVGNKIAKECAASDKHFFIDNDKKIPVPLILQALMENDKVEQFAEGLGSGNFKLLLNSLCERSYDDNSGIRKFCEKDKLQEAPHPDAGIHKILSEGRLKLDPYGPGGDYEVTSKKVLTRSLDDKTQRLIDGVINDAASTEGSDYEPVKLFCELLLNELDSSNRSSKEYLNAGVNKEALEEALASTDFENTRRPELA